MKDNPSSTILPRFLPVVVLAIFQIPSLCWGQSQPGASQPDQSQPGGLAEKDVLLFTNGEKLIGTLQRSSGSSVVFHSDMAGDVTVDWSKIKELKSAQKFAVVPKGTNLEKSDSAGSIPEGTVSVAESKLQLKKKEDAAPVTMPLSETADVINADLFDKVVLHRPAWYQKWKGSATVGAAVVNATQKSQIYTSGVSFVRAIPGEDWMNPENRTSLNFTSSYGKLTQPNTPQVKTSIFHADAERDHYFSPRLFLFAEATFSHDYSQGLDLSQTYGGGIGWTVIKDPDSQFDVKSELGYTNQMFTDPTNNQKLFGSIFSESYNRKLLNKITFHEDVSVSPSWSNLHAYSATGNTNLTVPLIKRLNFTVGVLDTFLNNPSPGFRKNSFQFTSGITLVLP